MIDYNAEARAVLARALKNYGKAVRSSNGGREHGDRFLDKRLKENVRRLIRTEDDNRRTGAERPKRG